MKHRNIHAGKLLRTIALTAVISALLLTGCGKKEVQQDTEPSESQSVTQPEPTRPTLAVTDTQEQEGSVVVATSYCTVKYPFAFSDMVRLDVVAESLVFTALLGEEEVPAFTLYFDGEAPIELGELVIPGTEETVSVTAELMQLPEQLPEESHASFFAVQEIFNDVLASLAENHNFTPAQ